MRTWNYRILYVLCIVSLLLFTACAEEPCAICSEAQARHALTEEEIAAANQTISIGGTDYAVTLEERGLRSDCHRWIDRYTLTDAPETGFHPRITTDTETGAFIGFSGFRPFPPIADIRSLSDEALKDAVEAQLGDLIDFSVYNTFEADYNPNNGGRHHYFLRWQVEREMLYNIGLVVELTADGSIDYVHKIDAGPDELPEHLRAERTRIKKIEAKLRDHLGRLSLHGIEYEPTMETLGLSHEKPVISYLVRIIEDGFVHCITVTIS